MHSICIADGLLELHSCSVYSPFTLCVTKYLADQAEVDRRAGESTGQKVNVRVEGKEGNVCYDYDVFKGN